MRRSFESPEALNKRNRAYREKMRKKGFKYMCVWVPSNLKEKIMKIIDQWRISDNSKYSI